MEPTSRDVSVCSKEGASGAATSDDSHGVQQVPDLFDVGVHLLDQRAIPRYFTWPRSRA